jgi:transposase
LADRQEWVVEFDRPQSRPAKDGAKTDGLDALRAARELLGRRQIAQPRARGVREGIRALMVARAGAQTSRANAIRQLKALIVTADPALPEQLRNLSTTVLLQRCRAFRLTDTATVEIRATKQAMRSLARRIDLLGDEVRDLDRELHRLITDAAPQLLDEPGIGVVTAAQLVISWSHPGRCRSDAAFARLAGACPVPANSGQTQQRHRLNQGGDRQLNRALHTIVVTRMREDDATKTYIQRRIAQGKTPREARRCLKRYIARHLYRLLENPPRRT